MESGVDTVDASIDDVNEKSIDVPEACSSAEGEAVIKCEETHTNDDSMNPEPSTNGNGVEESGDGVAVEAGVLDTESNEVDAEVKLEEESTESASVDVTAEATTKSVPEGEECSKSSETNLSEPAPEYKHFRTADPNSALVKSFTIKGLTQPGGWRGSDDLFSIFTMSASFSLDFPPPPEGSNQKQGTASLTFKDADDARAAYKKAEHIIIYKKRLILEAHPDFFLPFFPQEALFNVSTHPSIRERTIFALNLAEQTDRSVVESIVGADYLEDLEFKPMHPKGKQAMLLMVNADACAATRIDCDGFTINDGETETTVRFLSCEEYEEYIKSLCEPFLTKAQEDELREAQQALESVKTASAAVEGENVPGENENETEEPNEDNVTRDIEEYLTLHRVNWADVNDKEELYQVADAVSAKWGGLPDSLLKPCLHRVLNAHFHREQAGWMRRQLETLIKIWNSEMVSSLLFERPTRVILKARRLDPPKERNRKRMRKGGVGEHSRAKRQQFGLGQILQQARAKLMTEDGEVELEEDDGGNYTIGGEALSFDNWAKVANTVPAPLPPQQQAESQEKKNRPGRNARWRMKLAELKEQGVDIGVEAEQELKALQKKEKREKEKEEQAEKEKEKEKENVVVAEPKQLEEGEVDSEDEKKKRRKKDASDSSSSSSSSSSESEDDSRQGSRQKRKERREKQRKQKTTQPPQPRLPKLLQDLYDRRHQVLGSMSHPHRVAFAAVLHQMQSKGAVMTNSQTEQMVQYMSKQFML